MKEQIIEVLEAFGRFSVRENDGFLIVRDDINEKEFKFSGGLSLAGACHLIKNIIYDDGYQDGIMLVQGRIKDALGIREHECQSGR